MKTEKSIVKNTPMNEQQLMRYKLIKKSQIVGLIFTLLFGPFGLLYASPKVAAIYFFSTIAIFWVLAEMNGPAMIFFYVSFFFSFIPSIILIANYNKRTKAYVQNSEEA